MSMKRSSDPRRLYSRNGIVHVCFDGRNYCAPEGSVISLEHPVTLEKMPSDGKRARAAVTQSRPGVKAVTETWRSGKVPTNARA